MTAARHAPATLRNRQPIREVLTRVLPERGVALEVASGTGEHAAFFAASFPTLVWQPSDADPGGLSSIAAHREATHLANLRAPLRLDVHAESWPLDAADAILCINMVHISPWSATVALLAGAARLLPAGAPLYLYGPYRVGGQHTAPSNAAFDSDLRARDPAWGVRDVETVVAEAERQGLELVETVAMPANNLSLWLRRRTV